MYAIIRSIYAAAAFAGSNFSSAAAVTLDAYGDGLSGALINVPSPSPKASQRIRCFYFCN